MKLFGKLEELVRVVFRKNTNPVTLEPGANTGSSDAVTFTLPEEAGPSSHEILSEDSTQTVTNKTLVVASNTVTTAASGNLAATELNAALSELQSDIDTRTASADFSSHTGASSAVHGVTGSVVGTSDTQSLTSKTIDADLNTITNLTNSAIKTGAAIDAAKIADGSVSSVEFQYLANVASDIQGQLDAKRDEADTLNDISGTLVISKGGTGQTTANAALNALLPTQTAQAGKVLSTDGTDTSWIAAGAGDVLLGGNTEGATVTLGTNDAQDLVLETANTARMTFGAAGGISTSEWLSSKENTLMTSTALTTNTTLSRSSNASYIVSATGLTVITLDDSYEVGDKVSIVNTSATGCVSVRANNADVLIVLNAFGTCEMLCVTSSPANNTGWVSLSHGGTSVSTVATGSSSTINSNAQLVGVSLLPGLWRVFATVSAINLSGTGSYLDAGISTTTAVVPSGGSSWGNVTQLGNISPNQGTATIVAEVDFTTASAATDLFLNFNTGTSGTASTYGKIIAVPIVRANV